MTTVAVKVSGPFFSLTGKDMDDVVDEAVKDLLTEGEREVKLELTPGHGLATGHYRNSVHGELTSSLHGDLDDSKVIYGPWLEGVGTRNERSRFKGYAAFRKATQKLESIKVEVVTRVVNRFISKVNR